MVVFLIFCNFLKIAKLQYTYYIYIFFLFVIFHGMLTLLRTRGVKMTNATCYDVSRNNKKIVPLVKKSKLCLKLLATYFWKSNFYARRGYQDNNLNCIIVQENSYKDSLIMNFSLIINYVS